MRTRVLVLLAVCSLHLMVVSGARGQTFGPPVATETLLQLLDREGNVRFTLASYYTRWENPFQVTLTKTHRLLARTPTSVLLEGSYAFNRHWSAGFWYNTIRGERLQQR